MPWGFKGKAVPWRALALAPKGLHSPTLARYEVQHVPFQVPPDGRCAEVAVVGATRGHKRGTRSTGKQGFSRRTSQGPAAHDWLRRARAALEPWHRWTAGPSLFPLSTASAQHSTGPATRVVGGWLQYLGIAGSRGGEGVMEQGSMGPGLSVVGSVMMSETRKRVREACLM